MSTPSFINYGNGTGTASTNLTVNTPTSDGTGQFWIACILGDHSTTLSTPAGWTLVDFVNDDGSGMFTITGAVYKRDPTDTEPGNYSWTFGTSSNSVGIIMSYTSSPIDVEDNETSLSNEGTFLCPSIITTGSADRLISVWMQRGGSVTVPGGQVLELSISNTNTYLAVSDEALSASGATGIRTCTDANGNNAIGFSIALTGTAVPLPGEDEQSIRWTVVDHWF